MCAKLQQIQRERVNFTVFVRSRSFISLPSFMFVNALVSELRKLNHKKKNSEISYLTTSLDI